MPDFNQSLIVFRKISMMTKTLPLRTEFDTCGQTEERVYANTSIETGRGDCHLGLADAT